MKILGIIPARGGSKGIPGKNIKLLAGKPLLAYTFRDAVASRFLSKLILSSDDPDIIQVAQQLGLEAPFIRPPQLSKDTTSSLDVVKHALNYYLDKGEHYDAVCLLQPTSPFREKELIDKAIQKFIEGNYDSLISVREVPAEYNPHWVFEESNGVLKLATGEKEIISRRQELPKAFIRDGAVYLTRKSVLLKENSLYGQKIGYINTTGSKYINLDTLSDWSTAEEIIRRR